MNNKEFFVYLVMPVFVKDNEEEEHKRVAYINSWKVAFKDNVNRILNRKFHIDITTPRVKDPQTICETIHSEYKNITKKGQMIRHELQRVDHLTNYANVNNSFFVLLDGSGKIDFDSAYSVLKGLQEKQAIFSCRPTSQAISDERVKVEFFENFLVEEKYKVELPDAQCGCWGFNLGVLKDMPLTAKSYEIELDVVINALEKKMDIGFIEVLVKNDNNMKPTNFTFDCNFEKLNFLCYKLQLTENILNFHYKNFIEKTGYCLPDRYTEYFSKVSFPTINYTKLDCIGGCVKECEKANKKVF